MYLLILRSILNRNAKQKYTKDWSLACTSPLMRFNQSTQPVSSIPVLPLLKRPQQPSSVLTWPPPPPLNVTHSASVGRLPLSNQSGLSWGYSWPLSMDHIRWFSGPEMRLLPSGHLTAKNYAMALCVCVFISVCAFDHSECVFVCARSACICNYIRCIFVYLRGGGPFLPGRGDWVIVNWGAGKGTGFEKRWVMNRLQPAVGLPHTHRVARRNLAVSLLVKTRGGEAVRYLYQCMTPLFTLVA